MGEGATVSGVGVVSTAPHCRALSPPSRLPPPTPLRSEHYTPRQTKRKPWRNILAVSLSLSLSFSTPLLLMRTPPLLPFSLYLISLVFSSPLIFSSFPPCLSRLNTSSFSRYHRLPSFVIRLSLFASPFNLFLR